MRLIFLLSALGVALPPFACAGETDGAELSGSVRARYESLDNHYRAGKFGSDQQFATNATLRLDVSRGQWGATAEIMDSRAYLTDSGSHVDLGMTNVLELIEANVNYTTDNGGAKVTAGRYTLDVGNRRLVGRNRFRNTTTSFAGLLVELAPEQDRQWTLFYSYPSRIQPASGAPLLDRERQTDDLDNSLVLWGGQLSDRRIFDEHALDAYLFVLDEKDAPDHASANRQLNTGGFRLARPPAPDRVDYQVEFTYQWGDRRATAAATDNRKLDVRAYLIHASLGMETRPGHRLRFAFDVVSGDDSPGDSAWGRYDTLFGPSVPDFGFTGIYGATARVNLISPEVRYAFTRGALDGYAAYRPIWLESDRDVYGRSGVRDANGASGRFAGHQLTAQVRYRAVRDTLRLEAGLAYLNRGDFLKSAPNAPGNGDTLYAFSAVTISF